VGGDPADLARILDLADTAPTANGAIAILEGIGEAQRLPGSRRVELAEAPALFDPERPSDGSIASAIVLVRRHFTWPGDPNPGGARPLTPEETARREKGRALFAVTCATCHALEGTGNAGLAPPLVGSPWVRDADEWLVRIALAGVTGPIQVDGEEWNLTMPGHAHDPRFDDEGLAGVLTHMRRAWGHAEEPVTPETVARIRAETADRVAPWTAEELLALPIEHRLDRFTGSYSVPIVGIELGVERKGSTLTLGMQGGPSGELREVGNGVFMAEGLMVEFEADDEGRVDSATVQREGTTFPISRDD
jgi:mono/diheme cytochrome c family protein